MESITGKGQHFDVGSLYAEFSQLEDPRKARGKRYRLETVLTLLVLAKVCGEDKPSGIAEWAQHRLEGLCEVLKLERGRWTILATHAGDEGVRAVPFEAIELALAALWGGASSHS